jgi:hypothetical protein
VCGSASRSWPHDAHLRTNVYLPNSSLSLLMWNSRGITQIVNAGDADVHPVPRRAQYCIGLSADRVLRGHDASEFTNDRNTGSKGRSWMAAAPMIAGTISALFA